MIEIGELHFAYQGGFQLFVGELRIGQGERVAWVGQSGSGKTTLLQLVAGILRPDQGSVKVCDRDLTRLSTGDCRKFRIRNLGLVFQEFELLDYLDVLDNVLLAYRISSSLKLDGEVRDRARELVASVGLENELHRRVDRLSHGQRQRVAICRGLVTRPKLVLADEPTANLDARNKQQVLDLLDRFARDHDASLVVVTHDQEVSNRFERCFEIAVDHADSDLVSASIHEVESRRDA